MQKTQMEDEMKEKILTLDGIALIVGFTLLVVLGLIQTLGMHKVIG